MQLPQALLDAELGVQRRKIGGFEGHAVDELVAVELADPRDAGLAHFALTVEQHDEAAGRSEIDTHTFESTGRPGCLRTDVRERGAYCRAPWRGTVARAQIGGNAGFFSRPWRCSARRAAPRNGRQPAPCARGGRAPCTPRLRARPDPPQPCPVSDCRPGRSSCRRRSRDRLSRRRRLTVGPSTSSSVWCVRPAISPQLCARCRILARRSFGGIAPQRRSRAIPAQQARRVNA